MTDWTPADIVYTIDPEASDGSIAAISFLTPLGRCVDHGGVRPEWR